MRVPVGVTTLHLSRRSALLVLLAVSLVGFGGYEHVQQTRAVDEAVAVRAPVEDAHVERLEGGRGIDYRPDVEYTYRYRGETYTSDRGFPGVTRRTYAERPRARSVVESYEPGTTVRAHVRPSAPANAFLIRERTPGPVRTVAVGGVLLVVAVLAGLGAEQPGRHELRSASDVQPSGRTWLDRNGERLRRPAKRLLGGCFAGFWLSMVGLLVGVLRATGGVGDPSRRLRADPVGPVGLPLLAGFGFWVGMVVALCLYGGWSFAEYRRLRRRLHEPRPPSPFRHPSRLVTILGTDGDDLSEYGRRVRLTGWAFVLAAGMAALVAWLLYTGG